MRTQQIIAEESGVANTTIRVAASSSNTTNKIEAQVYDYWRRSKNLRVLPAIEKGFFQSEISNAAYEYQRQIERRPQDRRRQRL